MDRSVFALAAAATLALAHAQPAPAQEFYAGKTLKILVGLDAGGTVDTAARLFALHLRNHIPGKPAIVIQNMPSAAGVGATNFLYEKAEPDGLTILYNSWDPLAQALGDQLLRARYDQFEYLGGTGDIRVNYARTDTVPGGIKSPRDIVKAGNVILGALNRTDISGLLPKFALQVLGIKHRMVVGYRGGQDVFLAMQRGEVQFHSTSISTFRSRNAAFVKSGDGIGIAYLVAVDRNGGYERSRYVTEMPAFPDLYKEVHGKLPSGPDWDALNWLTSQIGEMTYVGFAPRDTPPAALAALRTGFEGASNDPEFVDDAIKRNGVPFTFVNVPRGQAIFRSLADVTPAVLATLKASIAAQN